MTPPEDEKAPALHRLLLRQLRKVGVADPSAGLSREESLALLERVSRTYSESDDDRYLLENTLDKVSREMQELYDALRRSAEVELARERDKLETVIQSTGDGLATLDADGRFTSLNPAGEKLLGWTGAAISDLRLFDLVDAAALDLPGGDAPVLREILASRPALRADDAVFAREDGGGFHASFVLTPIRDGEDLSGAVLVFRDVSAQKEIEEALRFASAEADAANRLKSEFLANVSHEIRTPLNAVIGLTGLLLDTGISGEEREYAELVRRSGEHLLTVLDDILDFSKIEAGRLDLEAIDFEVREVAEEAVELFAETTATKELRLLCHVPASVPATLRGDPGRLRQVLTNLLGNAVKFTERGHVILNVSLVQGTASDVLLRFSVTDTGIGIPVDARRQLFEPFAQADGSTTRRFGGTGLGLAISRQLTHLMGGEIGVHSKDGEGSSFWFTARFERSPEVEAPPCGPELGGLRALVVVPHPVARDVLVKQLASFGMSASGAASARAARDLLGSASRSESPLDVVLFDAEAASRDGADGGDPLRSLSEAARRAGVPVVLLLPFGRPLPAETLDRTVFRASATWPLRLAAIRGAVAEATGRSAEPREPPPARPVRPAPEPEGRAPLVLVAEDNVVNQKVAVYLLRRLGCRSEVVATGTEAVSALERRRYDAVLMDCMMPDMDGYEAARRIRSREAGGRRTPIVAMTANAMTGEREKCLASGMDDYVTKPVRAEVLGALLDRWVRDGDREQTEA